MATRELSATPPRCCARSASHAGREHLRPNGRAAIASSAGVVRGRGDGAAVDSADRAGDLHRSPRHVSAAAALSLDAMLIVCRGGMMAETKFERHRQPWRQDEIQKLHLLAGKGMSLKAIARALTRSEESVKDRAKADRLTISKLR